jgi:hypothetical protein
MRLVKLFIISVIVLSFILFVISLFIPSHIRISRAVEISASRQKVFDGVNDLKTWDKWNQFTAASSLTNKIFSSPSYGYAALMKTDQLSVVITDSKPDSINTDWSQLIGKHFKSGFLFVEPKPGDIAVQWHFDFDFKWYPWEKLSALVYDKQLGSLMEESLTNLKHLAESNP